VKAILANGGVPVLGRGRRKEERKTDAHYEGENSGGKGVTAGVSEAAWKGWGMKSEPGVTAGRRRWMRLAAKPTSWNVAALDSGGGVGGKVAAGGTRRASLWKEEEGLS